MAENTQKAPKEMSFLEHLEELRWTLMRSSVAILVFAILAFVYKDIVFDKIILGPKSPDFITARVLCHLSKQLAGWSSLFSAEGLCLNTKQLNLISITMAGQFNSHLMISLIVGIIVSIPYIFYEIWRFIKPALNDKERKYSRGFISVTSLLFLLGVFFGYFIVCPISVNFFASYTISDQIVNQVNLMSYINLVATLSLGCGIVFELPIIIYFLSKLGILSPMFLKKYRRHAIIIILIIAAIITPPDVFSQILVTIPLLFLYEISIIVSSRIYNKKQNS